MSLKPVPIAVKHMDDGQWYADIYSKNNQFLAYAQQPVGIIGSVCFEFVVLTFDYTSCTTVKVKGKGLDISYSTAYMSQTRDQQLFTAR